MTLRQWLAWKLVCIAARIYDAEWDEGIEITTPTGTRIEISVLGSEYGYGISSTSGIHWQLGPPETTEIDNWKFTWLEPQKHKEANA